MTDLARISLETTHTRLGWPRSDEILRPPGAAASVFARLVHEKIEVAIRRFPEARDSKFGVLMGDPDASTSEPPLAIVAESSNEFKTETLRELHRLAWNFSHVPIVITIEPNLLRVWSCCEAPDTNRGISDYIVESVSAEHFDDRHTIDLEFSAARALHWINLVSGQFFADRSSRFDRDGRADQMLLKNLRYIRGQLSGEGLDNDDVCHDLLARVIFVQFLFDRKDQEGRSALNSVTLHRLCLEGVLKRAHDSFAGVLSNYEDTYNLFEWLNGKFNGDLFPGKGKTSSDRAKDWVTEKEIVEPKHLAILADFISGTLDMPSQQVNLWPQYSFDVIPLEFISCIYEAFVTEKSDRDGIYYTPSYLVDFVLDRILPWNDPNWDLKILDPACGSGIFLVKAFQRLVHRWKLSNGGATVRVETLRRLLEKNIFGVDKDRHAVRVACFSLYLAMCDEIEPRYYWTQVTFPQMRQRRLVCADFFEDDHEGFATGADSGAYDLIIGNAPFGRGVVTTAARRWAATGQRNWIIPNNDIGGLFLAKSAQLISETGRVALIQSANTILFNIGSAAQFRKQIFSRHQIEEVYNLSALRFRVFQKRWHTTKKSVAPVCVIIMRRRKPSSESTIRYISPKATRPLVDEFTIIVEPNDERSVSLADATDGSAIWSILMWGSARDVQLVRKLRGYGSLHEAVAEGIVHVRGGVVYGDRTREAPHYEGMRIFDGKMFPGHDPLWLDARGLPTVKGVRVHSRDSTDMDAFQWPQLIVKRSWHKPSGRFHARMIRSSKRKGILCNQSYFAVHGPADVLEAAAMAHNSDVSVYFHFLTSGRFAAYRPKLSKDEVLRMPIPLPDDGMSENMENLEQLNRKMFQLFGLKDAERVLVEDALEYTIGDFLGNVGSLGRQKTTSRDGGEEHLRKYCEYFFRVMKAGFGKDRSISATIFRSTSGGMPYRMIAVTLGGIPDDGVEIREISSLELLEELHRLATSKTGGRGAFFNQNIIRIYQAYMDRPTVFLIKPDQKRFWTRSAGLRDGDEVALDLFRWRQMESKEDAKVRH